MSHSPCIINLPAYIIQSGAHTTYDKMVLIQIADNDQEFITPKWDFDFIYRYRFMDSEDSTGISESQAVQIANILDVCLKEGYNVLVHCNAGLCRSGAVVEYGVAIGFEDTRKIRMPNLRVKRMLFDRRSTWGSRCDL